MAKGNQTHGPIGFIKRFVGNKNTVTILGVLACIATLIIGYHYRVKISINPKTVPFAKVSIPARTVIEANMVGNIKISSTYTQAADNLIMDSGKVVNKYATYKSNIPKNSLFYKEMVLEQDEMPDAAFAHIGDGYTIFSLDISLKESFYNSARAGNYIDLYVLARDKDENNKIIYARLVKSIRILAVKDSKGRNIVKNGVDNGKPSELLFAVKDADYDVLMKASLLGDSQVNIEPVLRNDAYTAAAGETEVNEGELRRYILDNCMDL